MRFELSNSFQGGMVSWRVRFVYGNSKSVREVELGPGLIGKMKVLCGSGKPAAAALGSIFESGGVADSLDPDRLQRVWSGRNEKYSHPHDLVDAIGRAALLVSVCVDQSLGERVVASIMESEGNPPGHQKVLRNCTSVFAGLLVGSLVNDLFGEAERARRKPAKAKKNEP
jgi:hypothetical protein